MAEVHVIVIDDCEDDVALVRRQLRRGGLDVEARWVDTEGELRHALAERRWDAVICDYAIPEFGAPRAFEVLRELGLDVPFIIVSGTITEEAAVSSLRAGAHDFVLKENLARLPTALTREIGEAKVRAELRRSQEAFARAEKLRSLGQMAAGVSHDLKNLLNPLALGLQLIERNLARGDIDAARTSVAEMKRTIARGVQTVERLRNYSRQAPDTGTEVVSLDALAHEAVEIARPCAATRGGQSRGMQLREELGSPPPIQARAEEIINAVVNLIVNAADAMPDGGTITVRTGVDAGDACVEVRDDGIGMSPEVQQHAFEPFFTTKGEAGTGLGLAIVYASVRRVGGHVTIDSAPGKGTTVTLRFPTGTT